MIDLHCHILPGLDDGAQTLEDSLEMARVAAGDGIRTMVATPHGAQWGTASTPEELEARVVQLQEALDSRGIPIHVLPGLENYLGPELTSGQAIPLNHTRYLLVELPFEEFPYYAEPVLFQLQVKGYLPILAHPERNAALRADPEVLRRLVERGILVQLTAASLLGVFGRRTREASEAFLRQGLVHVLATDSHSAGGGRRPVLSEALDLASRLVGRERAQDLVTTTPERILKGEAVELEAPLEARPRRWAFWR